ncbi:cation diffusion facilitator family transporter [Metabacillus herbersteinensis]|uniref:Cation diffusion facilitator family transporter n=1 Tax=Metabacillus herbersteinensis TaxID=283816 RepID=A0ABV6GAD3_9BACI
MDIYSDLKQGERGAWLSIGAYLILSSLKLTVGYMYSSQALLADGLNNSTDVVASVAVLLGLKISQKPPDHDHPYGHLRAETISALVASFIIMTVGVQVLFEGFKSILETKEESPNIITAWVALASAIVMLGVHLYNRRLAKKTNSKALFAASQDNRSDAFISLGAFIGILASQFGFAWVDTVTAITIGLIICKTAWDIFKDATHSLTDGFDMKILKEFQETIETTPGVETLKDIKARYLGSSVLVDVVIEVDSGLSVTDSHDITDQVEERMKSEHNISHVHVHIEPV